jgi:hypothetical protein
MPIFKSSATTDTSGFIHKDGSVDFTADQSMAGNELTNLAVPTSGSSAQRRDLTVNRTVTYSPLSEPPADPVAGDRWIVTVGA